MVSDLEPLMITLDVDSHLFDKLHQIEKAGLSVVEINSVDPALLKNVLQKFPRFRIGAGNVTNTQQLEDCYKAGVHFITSPGFLPTIVQTANIYSLNYLPGIATLSEGMHAVFLGCLQVKPFPATLPFCTLLNKYLPQLKLFPAEIEWDDIEHFLNLPAVAGVSIINPEVKLLQSLNASLST